MIPYVFCFMLVCLFAHIADKLSHNKICYFTCTLICVVIVSVFAGFRNYGVGTDTTVYVDYYFFLSRSINSWKELLSNSEEVDVGFLLLNKLASLFGHNSWLPLFFVELFISGITFFIGAIWARKEKFKFSLFILFYSLILFNPSLCFLRQFCAISLLFVGTYMLIIGKWKLYLLFQILGYLFHSSSILFVLIPIIYYVSKIESDKIKWSITISIILFIFIVLDSFGEYMNSFSSYGFVSETHAERYGKLNEYEGLNLGLLFYVSSLFVFLLIFNGYKQNVLNKEQFFFYVSCHLLFVSFGYFATYVTYLRRLSYYFSMIEIICFSIIVSSCRIEKRFKYAFVIFYIYLWYRTFILSNTGETYPYKSNLLEIL